ncbi:hypothetical protein O53_1259 [Microcystis aeruginosa TAIHU98]|jgi:hypothetical protein|uniref:Uncharacterized protein n=2 Tax=Microcystis TaxID=1125 RepID=L7EB35_MICAE|nr:hypothetical protein [Microcystis aeruginosa]ELP56650.1 hypothetical protein O53_1259 [Microcystis aeruginosa TAIHU98]MBE9244387.1 hypothetical protein [Microcystis aeruginosa LEGE 00239]REJ41211.1 MAG: hypothetical protein DWQ54_16290 [Microcystis flos-aquae TF09]
MNAQEELQLQEHLQAIGKILARNTPQEQWKDFEAIELAVREHLLTTVSPAISSIFWTKLREQRQLEPEKSTVSWEK